MLTLGNASELFFLFYFVREWATTDLFRKQAVHDKEHHSLKAGKDGEQVRHDYGALVKLETSKDPHGAQDTQLSHCSNSERPAGGNKDSYESITGKSRVCFFLLLSL